MDKTMYGILKTTGICPIMVNPELDFAADAAHALAEGGLRCARFFCTVMNTRLKE